MSDKPWSDWTSEEKAERYQANLTALKPSLRRLVAVAMFAHDQWTAERMNEVLRDC